MSIGDVHIETSMGSALYEQLLWFSLVFFLSNTYLLMSACMDGGSGGTRYQIPKDSL